jgi:hypothetical protein
MKTELEQIEKMSPAKLFKPKFMPTLLKAIEFEVTANVPDVETSDGRKAITSLAYKIARSKTTIDDLGKGFVAEQKSAIAAVDAVRKSARDFLDNLKLQVRKPLTDWEEAEQLRIDKILAKIQVIKDLGELTDDHGAHIPAATLDANVEKLRYMKITKLYAEYQDEAINAKNAAIVQLVEAVPAQEEREFEEENNLRRANEEAENNRIEEEQRIAREAVENAEIESATELKRIQDKVAQETADKAKRERDTKHKGRIHREAAADIETILKSIEPGSIGWDEISKKIVKALVKNQIRHTIINY